MRLKSGMPFGLHFIMGEPSPVEGLIAAAVIGSPEDLAKHPDGPLTRVHSGCLYSELGTSPDIEAWLRHGALDPYEGLVSPLQRSKKCDCRAQRIEAQDRIAREGGIYFDLAEQECRGWGLLLKREFYRLQEEEGMDTVEAGAHLQKAFDIRRYRACGQFLLNNLGLKRVRLLTNNKNKEEGLEDQGISVTRVPLVVGVTEDNIGYLRTKRDKARHGFPEDLKPSL